MLNFIFELTDDWHVVPLSDGVMSDGGGVLHPSLLIRGSDQVTQGSDLSLHGLQA